LSGPFDPSSTDTTAGFHYAFSIDADTTGSATYANSGTNTSANFGIVAAGTHTIYARIIDKDNGSTEYHADATLIPAMTTTAVSAPDVTYNANGVVTVTESSASGTP